MTYDEIQDMMQVDSKIDQANLLGESLRIPVLVNKWLSVLDSEKRFLKALELEYQKIYKNRYEYYQGRSDDSDQLNLRIQKSEMGIYLDADEVMQKIEVRRWNQQTKVNRIQEFLKHMIASRSFCVKQAIDILKFNHGLNF